MSNLPRASLSEPQAPTQTPGPPDGERKGLGGSWRRLLRPSTVENAVLITDIILIAAVGLLCGLGYLTIATGTVANQTQFAGVGVAVAANFAAIMAARRNYRLKNLQLFGKQIRDTIFVWSGVYGVLAFAAFAMKISSEFSRGSTILFFFTGLATLLCWRYLVAHFIALSI